MRGLMACGKELVVVGDGDVVVVVHPSSGVVHGVSTAGVVFECSCGVVERFAAEWMACAAAFDHARAVGRGDAFWWGVRL